MPLVLQCGMMQHQVFLERVAVLIEPFVYIIDNLYVRLEYSLVLYLDPRVHLDPHLKLLQVPIHYDDFLLTRENRVHALLR